MARIAGIDVPNDKVVVFFFFFIHGIGRSLAKQIVANAKVDPTKRVKDLTEAELTAIRAEISNGDYKIEGDLRREVNLNIKRLMEIGCYRGQRSKTNARTCKGPKKTVANKKKATM